MSIPDSCDHRVSVQFCLPTLTNPIRPQSQCSTNHQVLPYRSCQAIVPNLGRTVQHLQKSEAGLKPGPSHTHASFLKGLQDNICKFRSVNMMCRSLVLKACPGFAQTEVQLRKQGDNSMVVRHDKLCQDAHKGMCLAFALQAMSQKHMQSAATSSMRKPISVHDAGLVQSRSDLAVAVIGEPKLIVGACDWLIHAFVLAIFCSFVHVLICLFVLSFTHSFIVHSCIHSFCLSYFPKNLPVLLRSVKVAQLLESAVSYLPPCQMPFVLAVTLVNCLDLRIAHSRTKYAPVD